ncbi:MAG: Rho-binding antiterminator [Thiomicrorhabdus sp.]|nr:Rho-binding antiterminator [Thiomicrorhabdus sp.]
MGISCSLYDQLEIASLRGHKVHLVFAAQNNEQKVVEGVIDNIYASKGREYLVLKNSEEHCLDRLLSISVIDSHHPV